MTAKPLIEAKREGSTSEIAQILGLSCRRVQQLVRAGILPKPVRKGKYDVSGACRAYCRYQRRTLKRLNGKRKKASTKKQQVRTGLSIEQLNAIINQELREMVIALRSPKKELPKLNLDLSEFQ